MRKDRNKGNIKILNRSALLVVICSILILSSVTVAFAEELHVSSSRYSLFAPWENKASDTSLSANFTAYALLLDNNGRPVSGQSITFKIYSNASSVIPKATKTNITQQNGLASVPYDTYNDFTGTGDTDYGTWRIEAYLTSNPSVINSTDMRIEEGGKVLGSCGQSYCHESDPTGKNDVYGAKPLSPYTDGYGLTNTRAVAAHKKTNHQNAGCPACHPGYAVDKTAKGSDDKVYGKTADVHGSRTCDFCHGNWSYITGSSLGNGTSMMPSCYQCHPVFNSNVMSISTVANLLDGNGISVYSYNYDLKKPLAAHNGTVYSLTDSVPCIACHGPAHNNSKPYNIGSTNGVTENEQCWSCHTSRATTHKLNTNCVGCHTQDAHNISISAGGGPDCLSCHNTGGSAAHKVDGIAMNSTSAVHKNLNSGASATVNAENKKCWGCHQTGGTQPADMGDRYLNPYKCYDCHNATKPYPGVNNALTVSEHFKNGTDIQAATSATDNSTSCIICHNITEMKVSYTEADLFNTQFSLASHYGKNRSELRTGAGGSTDCRYCHQNVSTLFSLAMNNTANNNLPNHSTSASTPICTDCHSTGKLHDSSLSKPANSDDNYCKTCHTTENEHKTLYCTECHANNADGSKAGRDIHGIKYLQKDNTFVTGNTGKTNAVDCKTCHQSNVVDSSLGTFTAEKIGELHHSNNITNGTRWGNYWISSGGACIYCHNDTRHSSTPLGRPLTWNPSYQMRTTIGSGTNCADCHYKDDSNYTLMSSAFTGAVLEKPPEITNGSWNGKLGYYNHTLSDYTDQQCKGCHYGGSGTTVGQMLHNTSEGVGGGPDCKSCHDIGSIAPKLINFSTANSSDSAHKNLNSGASSTVDAENKKCWACHGDGTQPSSHPSNYKSPVNCENCHTAGQYSAPLVYEHDQIGQDVITAVNCTQCHENSGMFVPFSDTGTVTHYVKYTTDKTTTPFGHFGSINTSNCILCHNGPYTGSLEWGSPVNISTSTKRQHTETTTAECDACHKDATVSTLANVDFHNAAIKLGAGGPNCLDCHSGAE